MATETKIFMKVLLFIYITTKLLKLPSSNIFCWNLRTNAKVLVYYTLKNDLYKGVKILSKDDAKVSPIAYDR